MKVLLIDTDVLSFSLKGDSRAGQYASYLQGNRLAISLMTVAELYQWASIHNWGARRISQLEDTLRAYLILPIDIHLCRIWGTVRAECRARGTPISPQDAWIAASAIYYDIELITHNVSDFKSVEGIRLIAAQ
jgi:predicted nucleic acid-binding protein